MEFPSSLVGTTKKVKTLTSRQTPSSFSNSVKKKKKNLACSRLSTYLGLSFAVVLGLLPKSSIPYLSSLQSRNRILGLKLFQAEDQRLRRKEDSKANARVVEIFASHRHAWQQEECRLSDQIEAANEEIERLRGRVGELEREVRERDEMLDLVAMRREEEEEQEEVRVRVSEGLWFGEMDEVSAAYYV